MKSATPGGVSTNVSHRDLARAVAVLLYIWVHWFPNRDLGHVIARELGYGAKSDERSD